MAEHYSIKKIEFSYLRALAAISVIVLHTFYAISFANPKAPLATTIALRQPVNLQMWAVPTFIMVTGALLLPPTKKITYRNLFQKKIGRIVLAIVVFTAIYEVVDVLLFHHVPAQNFLFSWINKVYSGRSWSPMWYLYMLIGLYLFLPAYKAVTEKFSKKDMLYLLSVYVFFLSVLPLLSTHIGKSGFYIHELTIYPFYLFLGYAVCEGWLDVKVRISLVLFCLTSVVIVLLTTLRYRYALEWLESWWSYSSPLVILQTFALFSFVRGAVHQTADKEKMDKRKRKPSVLSMILQRVDAYSFGIYLVHIIWVKLFVEKAMPAFFGTIGLVAMGWAYVLLTCTLSYVVVALLKRVKVINAIL